jgi:hypothetical protein
MRRGSVNRRYRTSLIAVFYFLATSGFEVYATGQGTYRKINACAFLKNDEVAALLNARIEAGTRTDSGEVNSENNITQRTYSSTCLWRLASGGLRPADPNLSLGGASYVILHVMQWPAGSAGGKRFLQSFRDAAKAGAIDHEPVPLKIAEEGLWWGDGVAACKGDRGFGISVHLVGDRDREREIEEKFARKIASRL